MLHTTDKMLVLTICLWACGPGEPEVLEPRPDPTEMSCEQFCDVALECGGELIAEAMEYDDRPSCVDACVLLTKSSAAHNENPECIDITIRMWDCGSSLPTCEEFDWFEYALMGMTGLLNTECTWEIDDYYEMCN